METWIAIIFYVSIINNDGDKFDFEPRYSKKHF